jgi:hypothetical protein
LVIAGAHEKSLPLGALTSAATEAGGECELIDDADATFLRNLPRVGAAVVRWLAKLEDRRQASSD